MDLSSLLDSHLLNRADSDTSSTGDHNMAILYVRADFIQNKWDNGRLHSQKQDIAVFHCLFVTYGEIHTHFLEEKHKYSIENNNWNIPWTLFKQQRHENLDKWFQSKTGYNTVCLVLRKWGKLNTQHVNGCQGQRTLSFKHQIGTACKRQRLNPQASSAIGDFRWDQLASQCLPQN